MKKLGILSFFPALPSHSLGEERLIQLPRLLSDTFDVTLVSLERPDQPANVITHSETNREKRFPKTPTYQQWHDKLYQKAKITNCSGLVCTIASPRHRTFVMAARELAAESDILMLEGPYLYPIVAKHRRHRQLLVYSAPMIETLAAREMYGNSWRGWWGRHRTSRIEKALVRDADLIIAQSSDDMQGFVEHFGAEASKMLFVPNGMNIERIRPCPDQETRLAARRMFKIPPNQKVALFNGWSSPASEQAADFIIHQLALECPHIHFHLAGHICGHYSGKLLPPNVRLHGYLNEIEIGHMIHAANAGIMPMLQPRQNWTEFLDFLSGGLPTICTPAAASGLQLEHRRHVLVFERNDIVRGIEELLMDGIVRRTLTRESRQVVEKRHSWESLAEIKRGIFSHKIGPRVLILNDYVVSPAEQGGQVRIDSVARNLADRGIRSTILTLRLRGWEERRQVAEKVEEINIPRGTFHFIADKVIKKYLNCSAEDVTALFLTRWLSPDFARSLRRELRMVDAVMLSHPYMQPIYHKNRRRGLPLYYDSHNTEYKLKQAIFPKNFLAKWMIKRVRRAEIDAATKAIATFCVSEGNRQELMEMVPGLHKRSHVCPNGVDVSQARIYGIDDKKHLRRRIGLKREYVAIFVGSGHPPNAEAARFIIKELSRFNARVLFVLVGTVHGWFWDDPQPGNVLFTGPVSTAVKNRLLSLSDFALNPMLTGSGTSLKMMDYMAAGLPILSTAVGARGLDDEELKSIVLLEPGDFNQGLQQLLVDRPRMEKLSADARNLAERRYDWSITLRTMTEYIAGELKKKMKDEG